MTATITTARQAVLRRRIRLLVAVTITYNVVEAVVALVAGTIASSVALIGFGPVSYTHLTLPTKA